MLRVVSAITSAPWFMPARYLRALHAIATRDPESVPKDIRERYEARQRGEGPHSVITNAGERLDGTRSVRFRDGVAIIPVIGPIFRYADFFTDISGALTIDDLSRDFAATMANPNVQDVVLYIDSPGGEANGIHEFANIVRIAADTSAKRVIAYIPGIGASAAYWIASACSEIVVDRTAMAPCIGVVFAVPDPSGEKDFIEIVSTQSPKKRLDVTTDDGRAQMQKWADDLAEIFISCVASNRGVSADTVTSPAWAEGSLDIGQALVTAGVADRLGSFEGLVSELVTTRRAGASPQNNSPRNKEKEMRDKTKTLPAAKAGEETPNNSQAAAAGGECDCCAIDSTPCGCASKDETADGVCSCTPDCSNCVEHECDGEQEAAAAKAGEVDQEAAAAAAAVPSTRAARGIAAAQELKRLRAEVSQLRRTGIVSEANALIESAVRDLKMPPLPAANGEKPAADTLSSLLRDTLVDSKMNDACSTCQTNHDRASKIVALLPPAVPTGRLAIKPVKEAAAIVSGNSATIAQADLHAAISEKLAGGGLRQGTKAYAKAYKKAHDELSAAAAAAAA